jgi:hypothetical protein
VAAITLADLQEFLRERSAQNTKSLHYEWVDVTFDRLADAGDPNALLTARFAGRPNNYAFTLVQVMSWEPHVDAETARWFVLDRSDVALIAAAIDDIVGPDREVWLCDLDPKSNLGIPRPHYAVWWKDFVLASPRGVFFLHFARSD